MLMPEPYRSQHDGYIANYLRTRKPSIIGVGRRVTGRRKNGTEFPVHLAVSEFTVRGEQYFTGIVRDLTELERVQKQLLQAERLAAIGQMVTGLAHESRNALQRAQACLDMLSLDLQDQKEQLDLARRATTALQDLHRLYEEVRGYAAPIHLEFRECDLAAIWHKEWENLAAARKGKQIELVDFSRFTATVLRSGRSSLRTGHAKYSGKCHSRLRYRRSNQRPLPGITVRRTTSGDDYHRR
jgi:signal transduction histidine kinase